MQSGHCRCVFWSGVSGLLRQGVIVLRWDETISPAFLKNLTIDHEVFDFVIYKWVKDKSQKEVQIEQGQESREAAGE